MFLVFLKQTHQNFEVMVLLLHVHTKLYRFVVFFYYQPVITPSHNIPFDDKVDLKKLVKT